MRPCLLILSALACQLLQMSCKTEETGLALRTQTNGNSATEPKYAGESNEVTSAFSVEQTTDQLTFDSGDTGGSTTASNMSLLETSTPMYDDVTNTTKNVSLMSTYNVYICSRVMGIGGLVYGVMSVGGLVGNGISIAVLARMPGSMASSLLLSVLAVWDSVFLFDIILLLVIKPVSDAFFPLPNLQRVYAYISLYGSPMLALSQLTATWTIVLLTCHRYIAVCRPHHAARLCRASVAKWQLFSVHVFTLVFSLPLFFDSKVIQVEVDDVIMYKRTFTSLGRDPLFQILYRSVLYLILAYAIPLTTLAVMASLLIRAVRQANKRRAEMTSGQSAAKEDVTKILIAVVVVFLACQIWNPILRIFAAVTLIRSGCQTDFLILSSIGSIMATLNSSVNFIIYIWFGETFRQTMKAIFCGKTVSTAKKSTSYAMKSSMTKTSNASSSVAGESDRNVQI